MEDDESFGEAWKIAAAEAGEGEETETETVSKETQSKKPAPEGKPEGGELAPKKEKPKPAAKAPSQEKEEPEPEKVKEDPPKGKDDPDTEEEPEETEEEPEEEEPKPKPKGKEPKPKSEKEKAFFEMAKELGFDVTEGNVREVTNFERSAFREKMRAKARQFQEQTKQVMGELKSKEESLREKYAAQEELRVAVEAADYDKIAKLLGKESWRAVNEDFFHRTTSPAHKELVALRKEQEKIQAERKEAEEKQKAAEAEQKRAKIYEEHRAEIRDTLKSSDEYKLFASDASFVQTVLQHQEESWDGTDTLSIEEAAELAKKDAYNLYSHLHKLFGPAGGQSTRQPGAGEAENTGKKPKRSISQTTATESSGTPDEDQSFEDWIKEFAPKFKRA
jgi:hypothetical protein